MLSFFRRMIFSKVGGFITLGILALIALAFAAGDITGLRGNGPGAALGTNVAEVGDEKIGEAEIKQRATVALDSYRQQQPALDMTAFVNGGGLNAVLDRTINGAAMDNFARTIGLTMSRKAVDGEIASIPAFQGPDGKFSQQAYEAILQQQRLTDRQVRSDITRDTLSRQLLAPTLGATQFPAQLALPYASLLLEKRHGTIAFVPVTAIDMGSPPADAELNAYYTRNRGRYSVPERRIARYAVVRAAAVAATAKPTDAEVAAAYKGQAARFAASEKRSVTQVMALDSATANSIAAKVKGGAAIAAAAREAGLEPSTFTALDKAALTTQTNAAVANAAFAAARGAVVGPVRSSGSYAILHIDTVEAVAAKSLAQATPELTAELTKAKGAEALAKIHDDIDDATIKSATFDEIVADAKLKPLLTPPLLGNGLDPELPTEQPRPDPMLTRVIGTAFTMDAGDSPQLVQVDPDGSFAVVAVGRIVPAAPRPLATIKPRVLRDFAIDRAMRTARTAASGVVTKIGKGTPIATALTETGLKLPTSQPLDASRAQLAATQTQLPPPVTLAFSMKAKTAKLLEAPNREGWFIVYLDSVESGNAAGNANLIAQTRQGLASVSGREFSEQFAAAVRNSVGVKRNEAEIAKLKRDLGGGAGAGDQ